MFTKAIGCLYSLPFFCQVADMKLSQTKRATYVREWRVGRREKRRFDALISGYVNTKYSSIYEECWQFYSSLNEKYPLKHDLTKTKEYKKWKNEMSKDESSDEDGDTGPVETTEHIQDTVEKDESSDEDGDTGPVETTEHIQDTAEIVAEPTTPDRTEQIQDRTEPIQDILEIAAEDLMSLSPQNINYLDNIIDDIIHDLQQDDELRAILDNNDFVQPQYMDEDEGIGLNTELELDAIIEPFDYDAEVEGFDF